MKDYLIEKVIKCKNEKQKLYNLLNDTQNKLYYRADKLTKKVEILVNPETVCWNDVQ